LLARAAVWASLSAVVAGCTDFPAIPANDCENGVVESREDCDTFGLGAGTSCRPKGTVGECHFDCSVHAGKRTRCPAGWGCDAEAICRRPSGGFEFASDAVDVGAWSLASGDFDGDQRADVMSLEPLDSAGATRVRFHYFDARAKLEATREFPKLVLSPVVENMSASLDSRSDVAFADSGIGLMLGRADRAWLPETFSSYRSAGASLRVTAIYDRQISQVSPLLPLITTSSGTGFYVPDPGTGKLGLHASFSGSVASLAGDPVSGNLLEDERSSPCLEPVLAELGASHFTVVNVCARDAQGQPVFRDLFEQTRIELVPRAAIDGAPLIADLNGDGHLDVLVGAQGTPYVSYGDGYGLATATPYAMPIADNDPTADMRFPLAAGDLTGDGVVDFVLPDYVLLSLKTGALVSYAAAAGNRLGAPWTAAKIGDFNGNGQLDVVAASNGALNLQFLNGDGAGQFTSTLISSEAPIASLADGDFDGDLIEDIAALQMPRAAQPKGSLLVSFGAPLGSPSAPVSVAQVSGAEQLGSYREGGIANLFVAATDTLAEVQSGSLTLLDGDPDRLPFAPLALSEFAANGSVQDALAISLAAGSFTAKRAGDVIAVGLTSRNERELWLVPAIDSPGSTPARLADLNQVLNPSVVAHLGFSADIGSLAVDLDGDGLDEAVFAMPAGSDRTQCGLLIVSANNPGPDSVNARAPLLLDRACPDPVLSATDLDGDHFSDLLLLTGAALSDSRELLVLWNDQNGGFSSSELTPVASGESPQAFTILPALPANSSLSPRSVGIAYVTKSAALLRTVIDGTHGFSEPTWLADLPGGSGISAGDVDGDGLVDLVLAASGELSVLQAQLWFP
jgi:hypothetical protein